MEDAFLAEQLERMRRFSESMSRAHDRVAENAELISRERDRLHSTPLHDVRDLRPVDTYDYRDRARPQPPASAKSSVPESASQPPRGSHASGRARRKDVHPARTRHRSAAAETPRRKRHR